MYNEMTLAIHEQETAIRERRFLRLEKRFFDLANSEGWNQEEIDLEYRRFENDPEDYFGGEW